MVGGRCWRDRARVNRETRDVSLPRDVMRARKVFAQVYIKTRLRFVEGFERLGENI